MLSTDDVALAMVMGHSKTPFLVQLHAKEMFFRSGSNEPDASNSNPHEAAARRGDKSLACGGTMVVEVLVVDDGVVGLILIVVLVVLVAFVMVIRNVVTFVVLMVVVVLVVRVLVVVVVEVLLV